MFISERSKVDEGCATCRARRLRAAILLAKAVGRSHSQIAQACGGGGYGKITFPTKRRCWIAAVGSGVAEIFALPCPARSRRSFLLVEAVGGCIREGRRRYPGSFRRTDWPLTMWRGARRHGRGHRAHARHAGGGVCAPCTAVGRTRRYAGACGFYAGLFQMDLMTGATARH